MTELILSIEDNNLLPKIKRLIKNLEGVRVSKQKTPTISFIGNKLLKDLDTFASYPEGWDGENAKPLSQKVIANFRDVMNKTEVNDLKNWKISPELDGSLYLESTVREAGIRLKEKSFTYFINQNNDIDGESDVKYTPSSLIKIIRKINNA